MKKVLATLLSVMLALGCVNGIDLTARAAETVDITSKITLIDGGNNYSSDMTTLTVMTGGYSVTMATPGGSYLANTNLNAGDVNPLDYIYVNDKSVTKHVEEYGKLASPVLGKHDYMKTLECNPICVRVSYGSPGFQLHILESYLQPKSYTITVKSGFQWTNSSGQTLVVQNDVEFFYKNGAWARKAIVTSEHDVTKLVRMEDKADYFSSDTSTTLIQLGSHSVTIPDTGSSYIVNTNQGYGESNLMEYILINGKTVKWHVEEYAKQENPVYGSNDNMKNTLAHNPIFVRVSNGSPGFQVCVLNSYLPAKSYSVTLKKGFTWINTNGEKMTTNKNVTYAYENGIFKSGAAKKVLTFDELEESQLSGQLGVKMTDYSAPTVQLVSEGTDTAKGAKVEWTYDGNKEVYLHAYQNGAWAEELIKQGDVYDYFRLWVNNPSHNHFDMSLVLENGSGKNYFALEGAKMVMKDGQQVQAEIVDVEELGALAAIRIPKQFVGWVSIPLNASDLRVANGYTGVMQSIAEATSVTLENRRIKASATIEDYYILDEFALAYGIVGNVKSTEDGTDYGEFDTSVKGSASLKNIIFMIGDGMGDGSLAAARLQRETLYLDQIDRIGYICTNNVSDEVTDSAAAGTALATGYKTNNGTLGLLEDGTPVMNLSEWMKRFGKKIGIVSSSYINDATPAAFASHTSSRGNYASITKDYMQLDVDLLLGGGTTQFNSAITLEDGSTMEGIEYAKTIGGYQYVTNKAELEKVTFGKVLGLFTGNYLNYAVSRPSTEPNLADLMTKSLSLLENDEEGFFLMVEGGNIDHANHANESANTISETIEFDDAVKIAMDFVDSHENSILVITADHETGDVKVKNGQVTYGSTSHTAELIPYYVYGEGKEYFEGITDNTQIPQAIQAATIGEKNVGASSILEAETLAESNIASAELQEGAVSFVAGNNIETMTIEESEATCAIVKYRNTVVGLCGKVDNSLVPYLHDGEWHVSEVVLFDQGESHQFAPLGCIREGNLNSIEIEGATVEIAYIAFFDSYEAAVAAQLSCERTDEMPQIKEPEPKHNTIHFEAVEPGCHFRGNVEYWYCSICDGFWTDEACTELTNSKNVILPATGSDNLVHVEAKAPTCTENGNVEYWHCTDCNGFWTDKACTVPSNSKNVIIGKTGHSIVNVPEVAASATKTGLTAGKKCSVCGAWEAKQTVVAKKKVTVSSTKISKLTAKKKAVTVKWKKKSGVTGYEIQVSLKKNFSKIKKKATIKKAKKTSTTIKGLKSGKKYYVRIRAYKYVDGGKFTSKWVVFKKPVKVK